MDLMIRAASTPKRQLEGVVRSMILSTIKQFTAGVPVRHDVYVFVVFKDIDETTTSLMMDS
eukprot:scaffold40748_cov105-Cyclotella_meneghiniana.AAC.1